jgi:hypothetical protein
MYYPENPIEESIETAVMNAYHKGHTYVHASWPKDIWKWKHDEIIEYLQDRLQMTTDDREYYNIMPYLVGIVEPKTLYKPFKATFS